jgi:hypothetical protein
VCLQKWKEARYTPERDILREYYWKERMFLRGEKEINVIVKEN